MFHKFAKAGFQGQVMAFHKHARSHKMCLCSVRDGIGFDAFDNAWSIVTDDFGNVVFVR